MSSELSTGLMIVHGNRAESLRDLLAGWIRRYPLAPLEPELVLVQSNGVAQWLKLALAADVADGGCGIAAALQFSLPSRFQWQAYRAVLGDEAVPASSPFDKERLTWRLMRLLPSFIGEPVFEPLRRFLAGDGDLRKRFQLAQRLADLFDQYQVYRADWLAAWAATDDCLIDARGQRRQLPAEQCWQAALWRRLLADMARPAGGRAGVHREFLAVAGSAAEARNGAARPTGLPRRVLVFGISALPRQTLEVLAAVARWSQVLLCVPNPCEHYWTDIVSGVDLLRASHSRQQRRAGMPALLAEEQLHLHAQPLLAAWGKQGRDFIGLLDEFDSEGARSSYAHLFSGQRIDLFESHGEATLLQQLQEDIRSLRPLAESRECWPAVVPGRDGSIRFHVAHTPQREVEVLHDRLLDALNADATLRPRDIVVMVPDIDTYAPHVQAVFGLLEPTDPRHIPFTLVDQSRRRSDPLVNALELLLALPQGRLGVGDLLDLLQAPALRCRFGIGEDQLPLLQRWVRGANVRWGLHAEQRTALGLTGSTDMNSWLFGLERMLLGYAVGDGEAWQGIEPYGEVGGLEAALAGPLAQLLARLDATWRSLRQPATAATWCERLRLLLDQFFDAGEDEEGSWTLQQLLQGLEQWREECEEAALQEELPLSVVAEQWLARLDQGGLNQRFFAGAVTFATLMPMRAIPFRHVCLLGMNDGDYPRPRMPVDFDLMATDYRPGDRSRRDDDRYLFLEALLSARERLHISWLGRSVADNTARPPSVLVGQLRDHLAAGWRVAEGGDLLAALTIEHPLQPFSPACFGDAPSPLFSYAREWLATAETETDHQPLPPPEREEPLTLAELGEFLRDPAKAFFRQRLRVGFERETMSDEDSEPFDLDGLERWRLQQTLIAAQSRALLAGDSHAAACEEELTRMRQRGDLPQGAFGDLVADELAEPMPELFAAYAEALARWPRPIEGEQPVELTLRVSEQTLELADWVGGLRQGDDGRGSIVLESSALIGNDNAYRSPVMIRHWVRHLGSNLTGPVTTLVLSKRGAVELLPLECEAARAALAELLAAWQQGMQSPLPLPALTAFAWLKALSKEAGKAGEADSAALERATAAARRAYEGDFNRAGEVAENPYLQRCWADFDALLATDRFGSWAERLLRPLQRAMHALADQRSAGGTKA